MIYIHELGSLSPKVADVECVPIVRRLKAEHNFPLQMIDIRQEFTKFFVTEQDVNVMERSLAQIPLTAQAIVEFANSGDPIYEVQNLQRAINMLNEIPLALVANIQFAKQIFIWQDAVLEEMLSILNSIPHIQTDDQRKIINDGLNKIYATLLRNDHRFGMHYIDIIGEQQKARMENLIESMEQGFFFRISLENQLKRTHFSDIIEHVPKESFVKVESVYSQIEIIKRGADAAYAANIRIVEWALILYSHMKWMMSVKL
jgi:disulfide oxidoreductase YuzD